MLRQICRRGRLDALLHDNALNGNPMAPAFSVLSPGTHLQTVNHDPKSILDSEVYEIILGYVNSACPNSTCFRHYKNYPHPLNANILPRLASEVKYMKHRGRNFSPQSIHPGNASISYRNADDFVVLGSILSIWMMDLNGEHRTFIIVSPHQLLSPEDQLRNPYANLPGFQCTVIYTSSNTIQTVNVIEPKHIVSHTAYFKRPAGTFGILKPITVVIESLYRNRD